MTNMNFVHNLQLLMKLHGNLSISELARQTNLPQPTLHHILSGTTKKPRRQALEALANFFSVSIAQLIGTLSFIPTVPNTIKEKLQISTVPIIDWSILKTWPQKNEVYLKEIILDRGIGSNSFALIMNHTDLEPLIPENSILIFDYQKKAKDRDFGIAYLSQNDCILFNKIFIEEPDIYIKQNQSDGNVKLIKLTQHDRIIATLVEVRMQF